MKTMRIILYGKGIMFQKYKNLLDWNQIIAIADKKAEKNEMIHNKPVILPDEIDRYQYDYIVIFSDKYFLNIRRELIGQNFVEPERILSWRFLISNNGISVSVETLKKFISELKIDTILDADQKVIPHFLFSREELNVTLFALDGIGEECYPYYKHIYNRLYNSVNQAAGPYDLVYSNQDWEMDICEFIKQLTFPWKYTLIRVPYAGYSAEKCKSWKEALKKENEVEIFFLQEGVYFLLSAKQDEPAEIDAKIYVVTHKQYNIKNDALYTPICVGECYKNENYLSELDGENISYLNNKINECTALYWIWKNTTNEYVGLNHYRRYFHKIGILSEDNCIDKELIQNILKEYDIILPECLCFHEMNIKQQLQMDIDPDAYEKGYKVIYDTISKHQPDYLEAFESVMHGYKMFMCNMFVMRRKMFEAYCEWLFSFIIEAAEKMDVKMYDKVSQRIIGFFAERMLTVWILKQDLKIKELPIDVW